VRVREMGRGRRRRRLAQPRWRFGLIRRMRRT
jgi:hypothetical protein